MNKKLLSVVALGLLIFPSLKAENAYGLPEDIQDGNILHCFNWPLSTIKENLPTIAEAGFGAVQVSPLQRADVLSNWHWYDLYCPYDIALKESAAMGSRADLVALCAEAENYGIKVIVDVVANHVNWTNGYYNTWWDSNQRTRNGRSQSKNINYNDREQITHNRLGDYYEVNSESREVIDRTVAYVKDLASCGVKGIRWDAAKHIALPSESFGGPFWAEVTSSVPGMYHYGEILDEPAIGQSALIKEYAKYMSVTDNRYSNISAKSNGGIPTSPNGQWVSSQGLPASKIVYWGESHDTYSNDDWSQNVDQSVIDRAYASVACRNGSTALYLSRPTNKGFGAIQIKKGTDAYKSRAISQVNKFRNVMTGRPDYFTNNGNAISVTRKDGGAVIVMKTSGDVSIGNGAGYCPAGTYKDRVSGNTFTVTASTISGTVGSTGIAVIYPEELGEYTPGEDDDNPTGGETPAWTIYFDNGSANWAGVSLYAYSPEPLGSWPGTPMAYDAESGYYKLTTTADLGGYNLIFNNNNGGSQTGDNVQAVNNGVYKFTGNKQSSGVYTGQTFVSGVESIGNDNVEIYVSGGFLNISNATAGRIAVYTLDGKVIYNSPATDHVSIRVNQGLYLVNINGKTTKLMVK